VAKRCEEGYHVAVEAQHLSLLQWKDFKNQIAGLEAEAPESSGRSLRRRMKR
jgi:hypothetical protein